MVAETSMDSRLSYKQCINTNGVIAPHSVVIAGFGKRGSRNVRFAPKATECCVAVK
jgi:hypothetical protein